MSCRAWFCLDVLSRFAFGSECLFGSSCLCHCHCLSFLFDSPFNTLFAHLGLEISLSLSLPPVFLFLSLPSFPACRSDRTGASFNALPSFHAHLCGEEGERRRASSEMGEREGSVFQIGPIAYALLIPCRLVCCGVGWSLPFSCFSVVLYRTRTRQNT